MRKLKTKIIFLALLIILSFVKVELLGSSSWDELECVIRKCLNFNRRGGIRYPDNVYIVIDAGHGGRDNGTDNKSKLGYPSDTESWGTFYEKNLTLNYAWKVKRILNKLGFKNVDLIRKADTTIRIAARAHRIEYLFEEAYNNYQAKCQ